MPKVPPEEQPILERLLNVRNRLSALKRDRSSYLKVEDIMPLRLETEAEADTLSELRGGILISEGRELNRTDDVLDEVLQMISLCFLCLGKTRESPAVYSQVVAIKHCFDRLEEIGVISEEMLLPYKNKLNEIENILVVDERNGALPDNVMHILKYKFIQCKKIYQKLMDANHEVSPEIASVRTQLLLLRRGLVTLACRRDYKASDVLPLQQELRAIDNRRVNGNFLDAEGNIPAGQAVVVGLLDQLFYYADDLAFAAAKDFSPSLRIIRDRLVDLKSQLERLELTHKWTLRQTDLFSYQHQLYDIVQMRCTESDNPEKIGKFLDEKGEAPVGQAVLTFLLWRCYYMIAVLLGQSVPVSEALTPVYHQLTSVRQCLLAVKGTGAPCSPEELYPYQMKLSSIDNLRKDGKFYDDRGHIPEGQALCVSTLEECYAILRELKEGSVDFEEVTENK